MSSVFLLILQTADRIPRFRKLFVLWLHRRQWINRSLHSGVSFSVRKRGLIAAIKMFRSGFLSRFAEIDADEQDREKMEMWREKKNYKTVAIPRQESLKLPDAAWNSELSLRLNNVERKTLLVRWTSASKRTTIPSFWSVGSRRDNWSVQLFGLSKPTDLNSIYCGHSCTFIHCIPICMSDNTTNIWRKIEDTIQLKNNKNSKPKN